MKNTILFLSFFIAISGLGQKIHFGPEIGTNLVQIEKTDLGKDFQPAWYSGIAFEYDFLDWLAIKSGVYYAQKRQSYSSTDTSLSDIISFMGDLGIEGVDLNTYTDIEGRTAQHYIEIPIMASVKVDGLSAYVGGYFGFMFAARNRETITEQTPFMST
ncbi:MAG: outer membrane beta-barrel protein, partial [Crocinitomicaceae bacterium]|nr:outer membrane beta-barrel protein [Crocinitomicaceae bacterium]